MEPHKKRRKSQRKKVPRVPIETYLWEDVRRSRLRGGYPWTHLYRSRFNEEADPSQYMMMEGMQKSKSSSALRKSSDGVDILDVSSSLDGRGKTSQEYLEPPSSSYFVITEVPSDSEIHSTDDGPRGSITIQEEIDDIQPPESESSDNISQYLDREEAQISDDAQLPSDISMVGPSSTTSEIENNKRAKSEEPTKKRKMSIDSSYSRKSLSKLAIMKKLKEASDKIKDQVDKIKVPRLSMPDFLHKGSSEETKKSKKEPEQKESVPKKKELLSQPPKDVKPVYIHIPLKPPEGEHDEFSYLEFEEKREGPPPPPPESTTEQPDLPEVKEPSKSPSRSSSNRSSKISKTPSEVMDIKETLIIPPGSEDRRLSDSDIVAVEILKSQTIDLEENGIDMKGDGSDIYIVQNSDDPHQDDLIIILPEPEDEKKDSRPPSRSVSRQGSRKARAKSAEPERKRKLSLESSYSRISLSKAGIMKKFKDAKDKLLSLSRSGSSKKPKKTKSESDLTTKKKEPSKKRDEGPLVIHIPLKPPPGQTDEFSYLEFEDKKPDEVVVSDAGPTTGELDEKTSEVKAEEQSSIESPASVQSNDAVQFIFLTPPSDDEILDGRGDIPETPACESSKEFFEGKVDELKKIAKHAVDKVSPETKRRQLQAVQEAKTEGNGEQEEEPNTEEHKLDTELDDVKPEKMVIDEEDGLKLTESAMAKQEQNIRAKEIKEQELLKSSLKCDGSPLLRKKVSFKRRSKDGSKEIYEQVTPQESIEKTENEDNTKDNLTDEQKNNKLSILGTSQSMSVDEEKSYLDEQKIIKSTSLEEDYNRWSKISDHEYEPINPPPDEATLPKVQITDTDKDFKPSVLGGLAKERTPVREPEISAQELQTELEEKFFAAAPKKATKTKITTSIMKTKAKTASSGTTTTTEITEETRPQGPGRFRKAFSDSAGKLRNKLHGIKKPHFTLPARPKFNKPKFNLPKIPDTTKITLPSFSLPTRNKTKRTLKETRHVSTESNAGDSKKSYFDFSTYPRIFKKKPKSDDIDFDAAKAIPEFATVPRTKKTEIKTKTKTTTREVDRWKGRDTIRIPLHPEESLEDNGITGNIQNDREDSVERRMAASHMRYDEDIDIDDAFEKENQEIHRASPFSNDYNSRWNHGSFHPDPKIEFREFEREYKVTDLDSPSSDTANKRINDSFDTNNGKDVHSSESSLGIHRRGVLEEIDSDEFFLRQKGISQDNIEVGAYLSSEIREAFKSPTNALTAMQRDPNEFQLKSSNQSLPEAPPKKKQIKKPKRKKTPHVSQEQISFDQEEDSEPDRYLGNLPPSRPKRRSKRNKKVKDEKEQVIPYQETIHVEVEPTSMGILGNTQTTDAIKDTYDFKYSEESDEELGIRDYDDRPAAPPRRNRSLRSLNFSERDSILGEFNVDKEIPAENVEVYKQEHEYIIPTPEIPPTKPPRTLSRSSSRLSHDQESYLDDEISAPIRPARSRSWTQSQGGESLNSENLQAAIEEPVCREDIRDHMGYAIIDKNQKREPPLPPPRTPPRRKKETKFFTTPRPLKEEAPVRPLRNYATLGPARPPRRKYLANLTDEEKESVGDLTQYIEIEEEQEQNKDKDLQSGEVLQKMRDRPLPAPPRPPRKAKSTASEATGSQQDLRDLESQILDGLESPVEETEIQLDHSTFIATSQRPPEERRVKRELITPSHYTYEEETVTHGSLVIEPLNGARILPDSQLTRSRERVVPVTKEYDYDDETSEIPEDFKKLKSPGTIRLQSSDSNPEVEILKAHKLKVTDLDVDRLNVNELLASKIVVSEIDSESIQTNEITSRTPGASLKIGEIELPPSVVQQLFERLQSVAQEQAASGSSTIKDSKDESVNPEQKKTPIEVDLVETINRTPPVQNDDSTPENNQQIQADSPPQPPIRTDSSAKGAKEYSPILEDAIQLEEVIIPREEQDDTQILLSQVEIQLLAQLQNEEVEPPQRPPRQTDRVRTDDSEPPRMEEPEVDDEPPPRPPQPQVTDYIPSQPPASFYALRAQQYVEDDIPMAPRRRRQPKSAKAPPRSSSDEEEEARPTASLTRRRYRSPDEPTIPQLTGQLLQACGSAANSNIKRLIAHVTDNVLANADGKQDLHVMTLIMLILIAGLILLGYGDEKTVHHHHWEYFNPPRDM